MLLRTGTRRPPGLAVGPVGPALVDGEVRASVRVVDGQAYERIVVATPWLLPGCDLGSVMAGALVSHRRPGDLVVVSEKVVVITTGRARPALGVAPTLLARTLAGQVHPIGDSKGLSIPAKMQYVVDTIGKPRILLAAAAALATRPFGVRGAFYVVAGRVARALDGMRPPFEHLLMPPLEPAEARRLAAGLARQLGLPVAIVDINDRGGSVRGVSGGATTPRLLRRILADNPLGHSDQRTPFGLVRPLDGGPPGPQERRRRRRITAPASVASLVCSTRRATT